MNGDRKHRYSSFALTKIMFTVVCYANTWVTFCQDVSSKTDEQRASFRFPTAEPCEFGKFFFVHLFNIDRK